MAYNNKLIYSHRHVTCVRVKKSARKNCISKSHGCGIQSNVCASCCRPSLEKKTAIPIILHWTPQSYWCIFFVCFQSFSETTVCI